jgi:archaellum biogenesis ATPase FlaH
MILHKRYQNLKFKFLLLGEKSKSPAFGTSWKEHNYKFDDDKVLNWYGNIGFICGYDDVRVLDIDNMLEAENFLKKTKLKTFIVKSKNGYHIYLKSGLDTNMKLSCGEFRATNQYVVAGGCIHPSGIKYEILKDEEVLFIEKEDLLELLVKYKLISDNIIGDEDKESKTHTYKQIKSTKKELEANVLPNLSEFMVDLITSQKSKEDLQTLGFPSRSERDAKVVATLLNKGFQNHIEAIFDNYSIGDKYKSHPSPKRYLRHTIESQAKFLGLRSESEMKLEHEIEQQNEKWLKRHVDTYLKKISLIKDNDWFFKECLLNILAFRLKIKRDTLDKKLSEIILRDEKRVVMTMTDLLNEEKTRVEYYVNPLIPKGALILLGGKAESSKSLFIQALFTNLLTTGKFLDFEKEKDFKVLLYAIDDASKETLKSRNHYIFDGLKEQGITVDKEVFKDFHILTTFDKFNLNRELAQCQKYDIIIFDAYRRFLTGSENDSDTVDKFFNSFLKKLKDQGKTLILIHHLKKIRLSDADSEDITDALRGSSDINAQPDLIIILEKSNNFVNETDLSEISYDVRLHIIKNRMALPLMPLGYRVVMNREKEYTTFKKVELSEIQSPKVRREAEILNMLKENKEGLGRQNIMNRVQAVLKCSDATVDNTLHSLMKSNMIQTSKHGVYQLTGLDIQELDLEEDKNDKKDKKEEGWF